MNKLVAAYEESAIDNAIPAVITATPKTLTVIPMTDRIHKLIRLIDITKEE